MDANAQNQAIEEMQKFIDELVSKRFAGEDISDDVRKELVKDATERLQQFILECTLDELSDEDVDIFEKMVKENKSPQEIQQFTMERIPEYPEFIQEVLEDFQDAYLEE